MTAGATKSNRAATPESFNVCGPLPRRHDAARGQCGHGQDLHHRGAHDALRGGRRPAHRPAPRHHLHPDGHGRAPRAGPRPACARLRRVGRRAGRRRHTDRRRDRAAPRRRVPPTSRERAATGWARPSRTSTAATIETTHGFCLQVLYGLGTAGDVDREVTLVEDVSDLMEEVVDDLYLRQVRQSAERTSTSRGMRQWRSRRKCPRPSRRRRRPGRLSDAEDAAVHRAGASPTAVREEMEQPEASAQDPHLRRRPDPPSRHAGRSDARARSPVRGCGSATTWCWSTSSRTPIPCSGRSCSRAFGQPAADARADRRPQTGHLRLPRAPTSTPTSTPQPGGAVRVDPGRELAQRRGPARRLRRAVRRRAARVGGHRLPQRSAPPTPTAEPRLVGAPVSAPLARPRSCTPTTASCRSRRSRGQPQAATARDFIARDLAADVGPAPRRHEPEVDQRAARRQRAEQTRCTPGHIAVLVRSNGHALTVRDALHRRGRARRHRRCRARCSGPSRPGTGCVCSRRSSGRRPGDRASLAALTCFVGWTAERVATAGRGRLGGPPLVAAPVGRPAARPGHRLPLREGQQRPRCAGPGARRSFG